LVGRCRWRTQVSFGGEREEREKIEPFLIAHIAFSRSVGFVDLTANEHILGIQPASTRTCNAVKRFDQFLISLEERVNGKRGRTKTYIPHRRKLQQQIRHRRTRRNLNRLILFLPQQPNQFLLRLLLDQIRSQDVDGTREGAETVAGGGADAYEGVGEGLEDWREEEGVEDVAAVGFEEGAEGGDGEEEALYVYDILDQLSCEQREEKEEKARESRRTSLILASSSSAFGVG
jgi:hypothetical protein